VHPFNITSITITKYKVLSGTYNAGRSDMLQSYASACERSDMQQLPVGPSMDIDIGVDIDEGTSVDTDMGVGNVRSVYSIG
jgi:hypothetical protein